jgi:hypothetical protein
VSVSLLFNLLQECHKSRANYFRSFVVIPGLGTLLPDRWSDHHGDIWLRSIKPESAPDVGIFAFHNKLAWEKKDLIWTQVEAQGAEFLGALYRLVQLNEVCDIGLRLVRPRLIKGKIKLDDCPIVLFSHSTGGFILKRVWMLFCLLLATMLTSKALCIAYRDPQRFRVLLRNIAGVVLLSCPHSHSDNVEAWKDVSTILRTLLRSKAAKHDISRQMVKGLAEDSLIFEQATEQVPVLSLYEKAKTKTPGIFGPKIIVSIIVISMKSV